MALACSCAFLRASYHATNHSLNLSKAWGRRKDATLFKIDTSQGINSLYNPLFQDHDDAMEIWKDVPQYEGYYQVSNLGRVKSLTRLVPSNGGFWKRPGVILKPYPNPRGYLWVSLLKNGVEKRRQVHRIVMEAFVGPSKQWVNHVDSNPKNNRFDNLEYSSPLENSIHAWTANRFPSRKGEKNGRSKLTDLERKEIQDKLKTHSRRELAKMYGVSKPTINRLAWAMTKVDEC